MSCGLQILRIAQVVVNMNDFRSSNRGFRFYKHLRVVDDLCYSGTKLKTLYTMYDSGLLLTGMTPGHELRALDPMISLRLLIT